MGKFSAGLVLCLAHPAVSAVQTGAAVQKSEKQASRKKAKVMLPWWVVTLKSGPIKLLTKLPKSSEQHWGCIRALGSFHAKLDIMERKQLPSAKHSSIGQLNEATNSHECCYNAVENQLWRSKHLTIPETENFCKKKILLGIFPRFSIISPCFTSSNSIKTNFPYPHLPIGYQRGQIRTSPARLTGVYSLTARQLQTSGMSWACLAPSSTKTRSLLTQVPFHRLCRSKITFATTFTLKFSWY